jgi:phosphopantothenoylcysteine decarboxylase/phosphopantothenate--cysteine ligase
LKSFLAARRKPNLTKLKNKSVLLGVSGGVAAYKSAELARRLRDKGAAVSVVMTGAAQKFITPLSLQVASQHKVHLSLFEDPLVHIDLPAQSDILILAPATANIISKAVHGIADDLLTTCLLSFRGPVLVAPSMNWKMYENPIIQENLRKLASLGFMQIGPETGSLACGEEGRGRLAEVPDIVEAAVMMLSHKDLCGERVVVTAGPTREYLDPVRFITNRSSGKMGFAMARAARDRGADVTLISGPTSLKAPFGIAFIPVETSAEMLGAVMTEMKKSATLLAMAAAVADFAPEKRSGYKIEKQAVMRIDIRQTEDIISRVTATKKKPFVIGFAAETGRDAARASEKMKRKKIDMIVFNDVTEKNAGFDVDTNRVTIIDTQGMNQTELMGKEEIAHRIFDRYVEIRA